MYLRNDIYDKYYDIKPVVGSDASKLSGITFDKEYRVFIGRPLEKAVGVYKYRGYKSYFFFVLMVFCGRLGSRVNVDKYYLC